MFLPFLIHSLFLIAAIGLTFFWINHPILSIYTLQLIAIFVLLYFLNNWLKIKIRAKKKYILGDQFISSIIFTMVVMFLVMSTGGLSSPLFFLVYFLLFGLSLILEPMITITLTAGLIIFFLFSTQSGDFDNLLSLISLILITPLSLFFGNQYLKVLNQKGEIKILKTKQLKNQKDIETEETNTLLWLSLNFKYTLTQTIDLITQAMEKPSLPLSQQQQLKKALNLLKKLLQSGTLLKEKIDRQTD